MKTLYIIRLGETENNVKKIWSGSRTDSPLTQKGISQANRVADLLIADSSISCIYASPAKRVLETARPLADKFSLKIIPDEAFQEIDIGDFDGRPQSEVIGTEMGKQFFSAPQYITFPGANASVLESQQKATVKIKELLDDLQMEKAIAIYTHGALLRVVLLKLLGFNDLSMFWKFQIGSCAVVQLIQKPNEKFMEMVNLVNFGSPFLTL